MHGHINIQFCNSVQYLKSPHNVDVHTSISTRTSAKRKTEFKERNSSLQPMCICNKGIMKLCSSVSIVTCYSLKDQGFVHVVMECKMSLIYGIFKTPWEEPHRLPLPNPRSFASIPTYEMMVYFLCTFRNFSSWDRTLQS